MRQAIVILGLCALAHALPYDGASGYDYKQSATVLRNQNIAEEAYPDAKDLKPAQEFQTGYIIDCRGDDKVCVATENCINGFVSANVLSQLESNENQKCEINREVCCAVRKEEEAPDSSNVVESVGLFDGGDSVAENNGYLPPVDVGQAPSDNFNNILIPPNEREEEGRIDLGPQLGCAAALICVEEQFCDLTGTIVKSPVSFTEDQILRRVPMVDCRNPDNGVVGKCCRDPDYVDPWPAGNLPPNYNGGFDEQGFPKFLNASRLNIKPAGVASNVNFGRGSRPVRPVANQIPIAQRPQFIQSPIAGQPITAQSQTNSVNVPQRIPVVQRPQQPIAQPARPINGGFNLGSFQPAAPIRQQQNIIQQAPIRPIAEASNQASNPVAAPSTDVRDFIAPHQPGARCGLINQVRRPNNIEDDATSFGEIPWEAMVLNNVERKLLCSGAFVAPNIVLTAAHCVYGLNPKIVSVKAGEWKLGYLLKHEEPLDFEIVEVAQIVAHPGYQPGLPSHDVAMLFLERPVTLDQHVDTICLSEGPITANRKCISTGWGKVVLQEHLAGALMHKIEVDMIPQDECRRRIENAESPVDVDDSLVCVKAHYARNNLCQVDVGGPLACDRGDGFYELVGVYSQDTGCLPTNQVTTFALIDTQWVREMISSGPVQVIENRPIQPEFGAVTVNRPRPIVVQETFRPTPSFVQVSTQRPQPQFFQTTTTTVRPITQTQFVQQSTRPQPRPQPQFIQTTTTTQRPIVIQEDVQSQQPNIIVEQPEYVVPSSPRPQFFQTTTTTTQRPQIQYVAPNTQRPQFQYVAPTTQRPQFKYVAPTTQRPQFQYVAQTSTTTQRPVTQPQPAPVQPQQPQVNYYEPRPQPTPAPRPQVIVQQQPQPQPQFFGQRTPVRQPQFVVQQPQPQRPQTFVPQQPQQQVFVPQQPQNFIGVSPQQPPQYQGPIKYQSNNFLDLPKENDASQGGYYYPRPEVPCDCQKSQLAPQQYLPPV